MFSGYVAPEKEWLARANRLERHYFAQVDETWSLTFGSRLDLNLTNRYRLDREPLVRNRIIAKLNQS